MVCCKVFAPRTKENPIKSHPKQSVHHLLRHTHILSKLHNNSVVAYAAILLNRVMILMVHFFLLLHRLSYIATESFMSNIQQFPLFYVIPM